jgi:predicted metal-binding membrane protein
MVATESRSVARAAAVTLVLAGGCWVLTVRQMSGMNMGVGTELGSLAFFLGIWAPMMAAMMLPGAVPAILQRAGSSGVLRAVTPFVMSYIAVWTLVGVLVYALYRPHGTLLAAIVVIAAGVYELTPMKRRCRERCRERVESGFGFGLECVGSSIGLMAVLVVVGVMSIAWMSVITIVLVVQKLLPARTALDLPIALAILALGLVIVISPSSVPGLMPPM